MGFFGVVGYFSGGFGVDEGFRRCASPWFVLVVGRVVLSELSPVLFGFVNR